MMPREIAALRAICQLRNNLCDATHRNIQAKAGLDKFATGRAVAGLVSQDMVVAIEKQSDLTILHAPTAKGWAASGIAPAPGLGAE